MGCSESKGWADSGGMPAQAGRVHLVTGGNSGIGLETITALAASGATTILCCRDEAKGKAAAEEAVKGLKARGVEAPGKIHVEALDLNSFASVKALTERAARGEGAFADGLDTVILNAGVMALPEQHKTVDGLEMQWQTNVAGHHVLVGGLLPLLRRSTKTPTVVPVSSIKAHEGRLSASTDMLAELRGDAKYDAWPVYSDTKQGNLLFAFELHRRHGSWLRVMPCHPGVSATNLFRHTPLGMFSFAFQTPHAGAQMELRAATDTELPNFTYVGTGNKWKGAPIAEEPKASSVDGATAAKLWSALEEVTGVSF